VPNTLKTLGYEVSSVPYAASMRALIATKTGIDAVVLDESSWERVALPWLFTLKYIGSPSL